MNHKYRKTIIAANWKMNKTPSETRTFGMEFKRLLPKGRWCEIVLCMPAICIPAGVKALKDTRVSIGAENMHAETFGAFTGEISAPMLTDAGVKYVILGHSERRAMGETDEDINGKLIAALDAGLTPILCVGESLHQRETGITFEHISMQLKSAVTGIVPEQLRRIVIAYEPIWAIGTGLTASPEEAQEVCEHIRTVIRKLSSAKTARATSILYGGSMNDKNAENLLSQPDIDGGLIGGASLDPEKLIRIVNAANLGQE